MIGLSVAACSGGRALVAARPPAGRALGRARRRAVQPRAMYSAALGRPRRAGRGDPDEPPMLRGADAAPAIRLGMVSRAGASRPENGSTKSRAMSIRCITCHAFGIRCLSVVRGCGWREVETRCIRAGFRPHMWATHRILCCLLCRHQPGLHCRWGVMADSIRQCFMCHSASSLVFPTRSCATLARQTSPTGELAVDRSSSEPRRNFDCCGGRVRSRLGITV